MTTQNINGPWPDVATARSFLSSLITPQAVELPEVDAAALAPWLIRHELGPLAYVRWQGQWPQLGQRLQPDWYAAAAENQLHQENLAQILAACVRQQLPVILLKGCALAQTVYPDPACRPMSDIDLWVAPERMAEAAAFMPSLGFTNREKEERPTSLQALSGGEIAFRRPDWTHGLVELHWAPIGGWWQYHTAVLDTTGMWQRRVPLNAKTASFVFQLDPEDTIIQLAVHIAVNHQFSGTLLRSLADIALTAAARPVNWQLLAHRAKEWRVGTAVYLTLYLTHQLFDLPASQPARHYLRPNRLRRWLLDRLVNPYLALNRADIRTSLARQLLLLLMVDRPLAMVRLIGRTVWPTADWRAARYGQPTSQLAHLRHLLRYRKI